MLVDRDGDAPSYTLLRGCGLEKEELHFQVYGASGRFRPDDLLLFTQTLLLAELQRQECIRIHACIGGPGE